MRKLFERLLQLVKDHPEIQNMFWIGVCVAVIVKIYAGGSSASTTGLVILATVISANVTEIFWEIISRKRVERAKLAVLAEVEGEMEQRAKKMVEEMLRAQGFEVDWNKNPEDYQFNEYEEEDLMYYRDMERIEAEKLRNLEPGNGNAVATDWQMWGIDDPNKDKKE